MLSIAYANIIFCQTRNNKSVKLVFGKTKTEQFACRVTAVPTSKATSKSNISLRCVTGGTGELTRNIHRCCQ